MDKPTTKLAPTASELKRLKDLLIWAKDNEIQLHEVDFGSVKLTLTDLNLFKAEEDDNPDYSRGGTAEPKSMYDDILRRRGVVTNGQ